MRANTQDVQQGSRRLEGWEREGENREGLTDLWKGEGWGRVHKVNRMDTTGTFRKEGREFEGGGFWLYYRG